MGDGESGGRWSTISGLLRGITSGAPSLFRPSQAPGERSSAPPAARSSPPAAGRPSVAPDGQRQRAWKKEDWQEDQRFIDALDLLNRGSKREALSMLQRLLRDDPNHEQARVEAFGLSILLQEPSAARAYADWMIHYYAGQKDGANMCMCYRAVRDLVPDLVWAEKSLVQVALAADKTGEARLIVDATKLLLTHYKESVALPRMLFATGRAQQKEGRHDLARATYAHLIATYPLDPLAKSAEEQLGKLNP